jgi:hypothetical protein
MAAAPIADGMPLYAETVVDSGLYEYESMDPSATTLQETRPLRAATSNVASPLQTQPWNLEEYSLEEPASSMNPSSEEGSAPTVRGANAPWLDAFENPFYRHAMPHKTTPNGTPAPAPTPSPAIALRPADNGDTRIVTQLNGLWKALILLALALACIALGVAAFAVSRTLSSTSSGSSGSGGTVASSAASTTDALANLRSAVSALNASHNVIPQLTEAVRLLNATLTDALASLPSTASLPPTSDAREILLDATAHRVGVLAGALDSLNVSIISNIVPRVNDLSSVVLAVNATLADQQAALSAAVPRLDFAMQSLNVTFASQQAALANLTALTWQLANPQTAVQVVSISPSGLSVCVNSTGNWTTQRFTNPNMTLCRKVADSGCGSIFVAVPNRTVYSRVEGWVTLYQLGNPDAFSATFASSTLGDSLTIWSGPTMLWDYAVGAWSTACPAVGGAQPSASLGGYWSCGTGNPQLPGPSAPVIYDVPIFGASHAFSRTLATSTTAPIELRFCLDEGRSTNEEIYLHSASIWVRA